MVGKESHACETMFRTWKMSRKKNAGFSPSVTESYMTTTKLFTKVDLDRSTFIKVSAIQSLQILDMIEFIPLVLKLNKIAWKEKEHLSIKCTN